MPGQGWALGSRGKPAGCWGCPGWGGAGRQSCWVWTCLHCLERLPSCPRAQKVAQGLAGRMDFLWLLSKEGPLREDPNSHLMTHSLRKHAAQPS